MYQAMEEKGETDEKGKAWSGKRRFKQTNARQWEEVLAGVVSTGRAGRRMPRVSHARRLGGGCLGTRFLFFSQLHARGEQQI